MLFIVSFLIFRQKAVVGLPTGKPRQKRPRITAQPFAFNLNQCKYEKTTNSKVCVSLCRW